MQDDSVHKPELPGVRTLGKDTPTEVDGVHFSDVTPTVPEKTVEAHDSTPARSGGAIGQNKQLFDVERAFNDETVQEGTIVTDRKHSRMSAGAMLKSAWSEWWGNTRRSVESTVTKLDVLKPEEKPTIETAQVRTNIIQEAAEHARQAPKDDHTIVIEKVRTFARDAETVTGKPFTIKEAVPVKSQWAKEEPKPKTEPQNERLEAKAVPTLDLRASTIAPKIGEHSPSSLSSYSTPEVDSKKVINPTPIQKERPAVASLVVPEKMSGKREEKKPSPTWSFFKGNDRAAADLRNAVESIPRPEVRVPRIESREPQQPKKHIEYTPVAKPLERAPEEAAPSATEVPRAVIPEKKQPEAVTPPAPPLPVRHISIPSNHFAFLQTVSPRLLYGIIILVGGGLGVAAAIFMVNSLNPNTLNTSSTEALETRPQFEFENPLDAGTVVPLHITNTSDAYYALLLVEIEKNTDPLSLFVPTAKSEDVEVTLTTSQFLEFSGMEVPGTLTRTLRDTFALGTIRTPTPEPFLVLHFSNFDTAFASMLSWERYMHKSLGPLFGNIPEPTERFADATAATQTIRILQDTAGAERIVYAFPNKETLVITTTTEALAQILTHIQ